MGDLYSWKSQAESRAPGKHLKTTTIKLNKPQTRNPMTPTEGWSNAAVKTTSGAWYI